MDESDLSRPQYNWGYDPLNYNVPEGSYATDPFRPEVRIKEFKEMVLALHRAGLRVVMDVVYNHTAQTRGSNFERTVPGYFYRKNEKGEFSNASGCGNETASERAMVRKFMVESLRYWVEEYHIDGFRFDLMGIHDLKTMQVIRDELYKIDPTLLLYGEGWTADVSVCPEDQRALKKNMAQLDGISAFGDEFRDGLRGAWADDKAGAFLAGVPGFEPMVKMGIVGAIEHPAAYRLAVAGTLGRTTRPDDKLCELSRRFVSGRPSAGYAAVCFGDRNGCPAETGFYGGADCTGYSVSLCRR